MFVYYLGKSLNLIHVLLNKKVPIENGISYFFWIEVFEFILLKTRILWNRTDRTIKIQTVARI